jgi:FixJ family two-component response regulator
MNSMREVIKREQVKRDAKILAWIKAGKTRKWIADQLGISRQRVYVICLRLNNGDQHGSEK